ncbi:MAG: hypothetical protein GC153_04400 [Alphaproteobacteria bacterium]|nr:hypothetical protein [Alphaproteobacteria bacterium]
MAETRNANTETGASDFSALFPTLEIGPLAEFNSRNFATAMRAGTAVMKGAAAYWGHVGKFVGRRLESDAEIAKTLSACRTGEDAIRAHHEFVSKMISDYSREMHELLTIGADIAKGVAEPIEERAEESVHSMESRTPAAAE